MHATIADLTVDEFSDLVRKVVTQTIADMFGDPDAGLELRQDLQVALRRSMDTIQSGGRTMPAAAVAARLGLEW